MLLTRVSDDSAELPLKVSHLMRLIVDRRVAQNGIGCDGRVGRKMGRDVSAAPVQAEGSGG